MKNFFLILFCQLALFGALQAQTPENPAVCPGDYLQLPFDKDIKINDNYVLPPFTPPTVPPPPLYRNIYWVHGLGGSSNSWASASASTDKPITDTASLMYNKYPPRKTQGHTFDYSETSMDAAADNLLNIIGQIDPVVDDISYDFIIAHSQGGIVSRFADYTLENSPSPADQRRFFGMVTFNTPNSGAQIVNSLNDGAIYSFVSDACQAYITGKIGSLYEKIPLLTFFLDPQLTTTTTLKVFCDTIGYNIVPGLLGKLRAPTTQGYYVGAPQLNMINGYDNPDLKKVAIRGVEYAEGEDPANPRQLLWRTLASMNGGSRAFSDVEDGNYVKMANDLRAEYQLEYIRHKEEVERLEDLGYPVNCNFVCAAFIHPIPVGICFSGCYLNNKKHEDAVALRDAYQRAIDWLDDADDQWKVIIGALEFSTTNISYCECVSEFGSPFYTPETNPQDCYAQGGQNGIEYCSWMTDIVPVSIYKESDGVVTRESQESFPGAVIGPRMEQVNHFQARNHTETADALMWLFTGGGGDWFLTDKQ